MGFKIKYPFGVRINSNSQFLWLIVALFVTSACTNDPKTPLLMEPEKKAKVITAKALPPIQSIQSKVDIVFMLDNSNSMEDEIADVLTNANLFTEKLSKFPQIDPHIGVLYVHDSTRYTNNPKQKNGVLKRNPETDKIQYFEKGQLVPLSEDNSQFYLTKKTLKSLPQYFDIEVPFVNVKSTKKVKGITKNIYPIGPEVEEAFSPILAATQNQEYADSFFRKDALLVIIFVTDAETADIPENELKKRPELKNIVEDITPHELYNQLLVFKGGKATDLLAYGVLCENTDKACQNNGIEHPAVKIKSFIDLVHDKRNTSLQARLKLSQRDKDNLDGLRFLDLSSDKWGEKLANIGQAISRETLLRPIHLNFTPEVVLEKNSKNVIVKITPQVTVSLGQQNLEYKKHWLYDAANNTITLLPSVLDIKNEKGEEFVVTGVAVEMGESAVPVSL